MRRVSAPIDHDALPSSDAPTTGPAAEPRRSPDRFVVVGAAVLVALVLTALLGLLVVRHRQSAPPAAAAASGSALRATGIPATVPTAIATLMGLSPVPASVAPGFTLEDQNGKTLSLSAFRGHPVVLEFMDPNCIDICPIVSQEFVDAYRDLGPAGPDVVFLGVNVNPYHTDVASVRAYSAAHSLDAVTSWHFLTGPVSALQSVWRDYNVSVSAPNATADVVHTSVVYFIDPAGQARYVAFPMVDHTANGTSYLPAGPTASWGRGIALVAASMR